MKKVHCSLCKKEFREVISLEASQAHGCASSIHERGGEWFIVSHYGSEHDTKKFIFSSFTPFNSDSDKELVEKSVICDECIDSMLKNKELFEDVDYDFFSGFYKLNEKYLIENQKSFKPTRCLQDIF